MDYDQENFKRKFESKFGKSRDPIHVNFAPGRVNIIGEHIDYNGGTVLPFAIDKGTFLMMRKNSGLPRLYSEQFKNCDPVEFHSWKNYPLGIINEFTRRFDFAPHYDFYFLSNLPIGAGLSSSASIELVTAFAINTLLCCPLGRLDLIDMAQRCENEFVGVPCGIMDQMAIGLGQKDHALALNCKNYQSEIIPLDLDNYQFILVDSKKRRSLQDGRFDRLVKNCQTILTHVRQKENINHLVDAHFESIQGLNPNLYRMGKHVISEQQRVQKSLKFIKKRDYVKLGEELYSSHKSLGQDYGVTISELDFLVEEAINFPKVVGARMVGAGFGGCTLNLVEKSFQEEFCQKIRMAYISFVGFGPQFTTLTSDDGVNSFGSIQ